VTFGFFLCGPIKNVVTEANLAIWHFPWWGRGRVGKYRRLENIVIFIDNIKHDIFDIFQKNENFE